MPLEKRMRAAGQAERANVQTDSEKSTTNEEHEVTGAEVMRIAAEILDKKGKEFDQENGLPFEFHVFMRTLEKLSAIADGAHRHSRDEVIKKVKRCVSFMEFAMTIGIVSSRKDANASIDKVFEIEGRDSDARE